MSTEDFFLLSPILFLKVFSLSFLAILFLQSGLDKVFNYKENYEWLKGHFAKTPLKSTVFFMVPLITLLEVAAGAFSAFGIFYLLVNGESGIGMIGAQLGCISVIALFFGQRIAKDYEGAATLVGYFLVCLAAIYILI